MANNGSAYGAAVDAFNTQYNPQAGQGKGGGSLWGGGNPTYSAPVPGSMVITHPSGATITLHPMTAINNGPTIPNIGPALPPTQVRVPPPLESPGGPTIPNVGPAKPGVNPAMGPAGSPVIPHVGPVRADPHYPTTPTGDPTIPSTGPARNPSAPGLPGGYPGWQPIGPPPPPNPTPPSPVTVDPNSPEGLAAALPDPNQINLRNWANLSPSEKAINYGLYQAKGGWTQSDIDAAVARAGQSYNGPRAGFIAPT